MVLPHALRVGKRVFPAGMVDASDAHRKMGKVIRSVPTSFCHDPVQSAPVSGTTTSLVSSFEGPLRRILLSIPNYAANTVAFRRIYRALARKLPEYTHFVILTHHRSRKVVAAWFRRRSHGACSACRIIAVADEIQFSMWAEDPYVVGRDAANRRTFVEPVRRRGGADDLIASLVAEGARLERKTSSLVFQGGNTLIGDRFYFVGADYLHDSLHMIAQTKLLGNSKGELTPSIRRAIRTEFLDGSRQPHFIGCKQPVPPAANSKIRVRVDSRRVATVTEYFHRSTRPGSVQPLFHIDMFITLAGREPDGRFRILVGDPRLAANISGMTDLPKHAMVNEFDEIAARLRAHRDFVVTRNPLPYVYLDTVKKRGTRTVRERWWYFATANNALVENRGPSQRRVWLPSYGYAKWKSLRATDALNKAIWEGLGFEVTMLPNFHPLAVSLGAVHCIKKYLGR